MAAEIAAAADLSQKTDRNPVEMCILVDITPRTRYDREGLQCESKKLERWGYGC